MNRRDALKALALAPLAPAAMPAAGAVVKPCFIHDPRLFEFDHRFVCLSRKVDWNSLTRNQKMDLWKRFRPKFSDLNLMEDTPSKAQHNADQFSDAKERLSKVCYGYL